MTVLEVDTPHGRARAHLHRVDGARAALVLGHGAGGGVGAPDLVAATEVALAAGIAVVLVEQPYRVAGRRSPAPAGQLDAAWTAVIDALVAGELRGLPLVVGGRSMGARVACRTAAATGAVGVLCLAFPLRPPRRTGAEPAPSRLPELEQVPVPMLVVQGARDPFGMPPAGARRTVVEVPGDHSLRAGLEAVAAAVADWLPHVVPRQNAGVPIDLETELDRLYAADLGEFVGERTGLVRALKQDGRKAEAARVQELRKPSLPAWAVNQLVRRRRKDVERLLEAGERLAAAQAELLGGGDPGAFAEAREREQAALKALRGEARKILAARASADTLERVATTLGAAALTAEGRKQLSEGRLTAELEPPGFEAFAGTPPGKAKRPSPPGGAAARTARHEATARARESLKEAKDREADLARQLREADRAVREASSALHAAEQEAERLRAERDEAAAAVERARSEVEAANRA